MRDIKFRVFNEVTGKMSDVKTMCGRYVWDYGVDPVYDSPQKMIDTAYDIEDKSHLIQFTGLKDKNGKEIYEGDILSAKHDKRGEGGWICGTFAHHPENAHIVVWEKDGEWSIRDSLGHNLGEALRWNKELEVIGNTYENPELLTGQAENAREAAQESAGMDSLKDVP